MNASGVKKKREKKKPSLEFIEILFQGISFCFVLFVFCSISARLDYGSFFFLEMMTLSDTVPSSHSCRRKK